MTRKRRQLSGSFKAKVALAALKGETTMAELSSKHAVHSNQVSAWKKQLLDGAESLFTDGRSRGAAREKAADEEALYEQIGRLKMEVEWLKKKAAEFE